MISTPTEAIATHYPFPASNHTLSSLPSLQEAPKRESVNEHLFRQEEAARRKRLQDKSRAEDDEALQDAQEALARNALQRQRQAEAERDRLRRAELDRIAEYMRRQEEEAQQEELARQRLDEETRRVEEEAAFVALRKRETQRLLEEAAAEGREQAAAEKARLLEAKGEEARLVSAMAAECGRLLDCLKTPSKPIEGPRHRVKLDGNEPGRLFARILGHEATYLELEAVKWAMGKSRKKKKLAPSDIYADINPVTSNPAAPPGAAGCTYTPCVFCHK